MLAMWLTRSIHQVYELKTSRDFSKSALIVVATYLKNFIAAFFTNPAHGAYLRKEDLTEQLIPVTIVGDCHF